MLFSTGTAILRPINGVTISVKPVLLQAKVALHEAERGSGIGMKPFGFLHPGMALIFAGIPK
jgi:hypothetical protein